ncbi:MAG: hypothetical protein Q8O59_01955 [bacterium]|nr:hypothetical protein [bacterium]
MGMANQAEVGSVRPVGQNVGPSQCNDKHPGEKSSILAKKILRLDLAIDKLRAKRFMLTLEKIGYL